MKKDCVRFQVTLRAETADKVNELAKRMRLSSAALIAHLIYAMEDSPAEANQMMTEQVRGALLKAFKVGEK